MSTHDTPEQKPSGTDPQFAPDATIIVANNSPGNKDVFHTNADCQALRNTTETVTKEHQHRPLNAEWCHYCRQRAVEGNE